MTGGADPGVMNIHDARFVCLAANFRGKINLIAGGADAWTDYDDQIGGDEVADRAESMDSYGNDPKFRSFPPGVKECSGGAFLGHDPYRSTVGHIDAECDAPGCSDKAIRSRDWLWRRLLHDSHLIAMNLFGCGERQAAKPLLFQQIPVYWPEHLHGLRPLHGHIEICNPAEKPGCNAGDSFKFPEGLNNANAQWSSN